MCTHYNFTIYTVYNFFTCLICSNKTCFCIYTYLFIFNFKILFKVQNSIFLMHLSIIFNTFKIIYSHCLWLIMRYCICRIHEILNIFQNKCVNNDVLKSVSCYLYYYLYLLIFWIRFNCNVLSFNNFVILTSLFYLGFIYFLFRI